MDNRRPAAWRAYRREYGGLVLLPLFLEWLSEWALFYLRRLAIFEVLAILANISVLGAVVFWGIDWWNADERAREQEKQKHLAAWQVISLARGAPGSGGRILALQDLNDDDVSLAGVDLTNAYLLNVSLPGAKLTDAVLTNAFLNGADLSGAILLTARLMNARLSAANLAGADLEAADLSDAVLDETVLVDAELSGTILRRVVLTGTDLRDAKHLTAEQLDQACIYPERPPRLPEELASYDLTRPNAEACPQARSRRP